MHCEIADARSDRRVHGRILRVHRQHQGPYGQRTSYCCRSPRPHVNTYTTNFPLTENPMSEGGKWMEGKTVGIDWDSISTTPGLAIGTAGPKRFADATALLTGSWAPTQTAEAVVLKKSDFHYPEISLRLRSAMSAHNCSGYEISNSLKSDATRLISSSSVGTVPWRTSPTWCRTMANSMELPPEMWSRQRSSETSLPPTNGVKFAQVTDNTYPEGNPGMGFNEGKNGDYGMTRFTATDAPITTQSQATP